MYGDPRKNDERRLCAFHGSSSSPEHSPGGESKALIRTRANLWEGGGSQRSRKRLGFAGTPRSP